MKHGSPVSTLRLLLLVVATITLGCNGGGSDAADPVGPDVRGNWVGRYYIRGGSNANEEAITATIRQDGDAIILNTSRVGIGANLTGTIGADGEMRLTDAFDGEIWTTFYQPVTTNFVQVADFITTPQPGTSTPLQIIELARAP